MNLDIFSNKDNIEQEYILKYFFTHRFPLP